MNNDDRRAYRAKRGIVHLCNAGVSVTGEGRGTTVRLCANPHQGNGYCHLHQPVIRTPEQDARVVASLKANGLL